ncbi:hypothetical protein D3C87_2018510 [compost metagenome]
MASAFFLPPGWKRLRARISCRKAVTASPRTTTGSKATVTSSGVAGTVPIAVTVLSGNIAL